MDKKVSILIPAFNAEKTICDTLDSCVKQDHPRLEIIVSDNNSTDRTIDLVHRYPQVTLYKNHSNKGCTANMNKLLSVSTGEYFVFLCADDLFTNSSVVSDIAKLFESDPKIGYIGRFYYQFIDGYRGAVRGHRTFNPFLAADNPSGLAFRRACLPLVVSDKKFVESVALVKQTLAKGWSYAIINYDTVAIRIGNNGSQKAEVYKESPVRNWIELVGRQKFVLTAFVSLVQLKCWADPKALYREIWLFIALRPVNLFRPDFWFFVLVTIIVPKKALRHLAAWYKHNVGRTFTPEIRRCPKYL